MDTDERLFSKFVQSGDEVALEKLFVKYRRMLRLSFRHRTQDDVLDEMVQRTFIKVVKHKDNFIQGMSFSAWVHTVADRTLKDLHKASFRRSRHEIPFTVFRDQNSPYAEWGADLYDDLSDLLEDGRERNPVENAIVNEDGPRAMVAFNDLPDHLRQSVKLMVLDGLSSRTAESLTNVTYRQVTNRCHTGLDRIRQLVA